MPNTVSAKKRVRQNIKARALNNWRKRTVKAQIKSCLKAIQDNDVKAAESEFRKACGLLDKVATTSTMHSNTAARRKSRLSRRIKALKAQGKS